MHTISGVQEHCLGCTACAHICPTSSICMKQDRKGFAYPHIDEDQCIDCGLCTTVCPYLQGYHHAKASSVTFFGVKHKQDSIRMQSSSGGAFTALSDYFLEQDGVVYGCGYDKLMHLVHQRVTTKEQRDHLRGSKYAQSNVDSLFFAVQDDLIQNRQVLFVGTPCQVAGLQNFLQKEYASLLLVDLICYGVASDQLLSDYFKLLEEKKGQKILDCSFRDKSRGWEKMTMRIQYENESEVLDASDSSFYTLFLKRLSLRPSCYECLFSNLDRPGDLTIGDFWGVEQVFANMYDQEGVSLVLVNSQKGNKVFQKLLPSLFYCETSYDKCLQQPLSCTTAAPKESVVFWETYEKKGYAFAAQQALSKIQEFHS